MSWKFRMQLEFQIYISLCSFKTFRKIVAQNNYVKNNFSSLCFHFLQLTSFKRPSRQLPEEISHLTFNFKKVELLSSLMTQLTTYSEKIIKKVKRNALLFSIFCGCARFCTVFCTFSLFRGSTVLL